METRVMRRQQEEQSSQMSHSVRLSSHIKKKSFTSSDEEASYADFFPIIPGDLMSVKEVLDVHFPRHRTWEVLKETLAADEEYHRDKWTMFGNEAEKVELDVLRNQRLLRCRADRASLRRKAEEKASARQRYLELLRRKAPDFSIPLRAHTVWEGMGVILCCTVEGRPAPRVTWYKDGVPLQRSGQPWNRAFKHSFGLHSLEIRRCSVADAGLYRVEAKSALGDASTFATLVVNSYQGVAAGWQRSQTSAVVPEPEAQFASTFPPTWVEEGQTLSLSCSFISDLTPLQQDMAWIRDGVQLHPSSSVEIQCSGRSASITAKGIHKEHEGVYTLRLRSGDGFLEHSTYVYVQDAASLVPGAPASPLAVQVSDVNKDYVFLTWEPPSADGAGPVEGYYVERCTPGGPWVRCSEKLQRFCFFPVFGLEAGTGFQFRVSAKNLAGVGRPSKATEPVYTQDPLEPGRTMVVKADKGRDIVITKDQLEGEVRVPLPPTDVRAGERSDSFVVLTWNEPDPRGREALSYYVERSLAGQNSWHLASMGVVVNSPRFPVFDLVKGVPYRFRVRSINKYGVSDPSQASPPVCLGEPPALPSAPHSVLAFRDTDSSVLLQWQEPARKDDVLGYYLYYSLAGTQDWKTVNNKPVTKTRFTVHGLRSQKEYVFRVKAVGRAGNSKYSDESSPIRVQAAIVAPSPPSALALLLCTGSEMVLTWRAPARDGGDPVRGYYLDKMEGWQEPWREVNTRPAAERLYKVGGLTAGSWYQFRVFAANAVGLGKPSEASAAFLCEEWTTPEPGCPYDLRVREVRCGSLMLLWEKPLYQGASPVTGYRLEISQDDQSESWAPLTDQPVPDTLYAVSGLQAGRTYRFRASAVNQAGVGGASVPSEPITAETRPGAGNVEIGVDDDGSIFLSYEAAESTEASTFLWSRDYREAIDGGRARVEDRSDRSVLTFKEPTEQDLGLYAVELSNDPTQSSSYTFTAQDLERLTELSWQVQHPLIALISGWNVEVTEEGGVRLWLQTEALSSDAELRMILNDAEICSSSRRKIKFDRAGGLVEILFDHLSHEDEGSYTAQLKDGRAQNQFTLVFLDQNFQQTLASAAASRRSHLKKSGPYFLELLSWAVTEKCELIIKCKVTNINKDSALKWFKDGKEVSQAKYDPSSGASQLTITQVTDGAAGVYRAQVSDGRGEDSSTLQLLGEELDEVRRHLSRQSALSAGPLRVQGTAEGLKLFCSMKLCLSFLQSSWFFKERGVAPGARATPGRDEQQLWLQICGPSEADRGPYTLEMSDGLETHRRRLDLSGQAFSDALQEHQRLKQEAFAEKNRAKVAKGLPDLVAIMEGKTLCLTCLLDGDPAPEVSWLRNDRELCSQGAVVVGREAQRSTLTLNNVVMADSGRYSVRVRNLHGGETANVTLGVYRPGEKPPAHAVHVV